ncbi:uncharacterized protein LOC124111956 [Haliotis rufescens]|uniref:uncharacterized protein LOC124111956 n=1 Tax=Haliotis rufescens TaxID=6454 RepID=UPI00201F4CCC|nr:uncharacterized protein LOC124111956 [Haliotis rufescens]
MMCDLEELKEGHAELAAQSGIPPPAPPWLDVEKFNRGRKFFQEYFYSNFLAMFTSLVGGLSVINLLEPLVFTKASDDPKKSWKRYFSTFRHVTCWHYGNVWDNESDAYRSVVDVRKIHNKVATQMNSSQQPERLYFSQYDMALVQCGFMGCIVLYPEYFGVPFHQAQIDDYVYFWKGMGYLLGMSDRYNICNDGYSSAWEKCKAIEQEVLIPALKKPPKDFLRMVEAFIGGANLMWKFKLLSFESVLAFGLEAMGEPRPKLGLTDTLRLYFQKMMVVLVRHCSFFRRQINRNMEMMMGCSKMK